MAAQKCSDRRKILRKVQSLVNNLVQINEAAYTLGKTLEATDATVVATSVDKILDAGGLSGVADTVSSEIILILAGTTEDADVGAVLSWSYLIES